MLNKHNWKLNPFPYAYIFYECHRGAQQQLTAIFAYLNSLSQTKLALWIFLDVRWSVTLGTANCLIKGTIKSGNKVRPHAVKIVTFKGAEVGGGRRAYRQNTFRQEKGNSGASLIGGETFWPRSQLCNRANWAKMGRETPQRPWTRCKVPNET